MKIPRILLPVFAFMWELVILLEIPEGHYIRSGIRHLPPGSSRPYVCWMDYSPSPIFILLALLPALVLLASYILSGKPSIRKLGLSMLATLSMALIVPVFTEDFAILLILLLLVSFGTGSILGKDLEERALLAFGGFLPGVVVLLGIAFHFYAAC
ncbi:hypothetical protein JCM16138_11660 [Thermococcus atlanticus]